MLTSIFLLIYWNIKLLHEFYLKAIFKKLSYIFVLSLKNCPSSVHMTKVFSIAIKYPLRQTKREKSWKTISFCVCGWRKKEKKKRKKRKKRKEKVSLAKQLLWLETDVWWKWKKNFSVRGTDVAKLIRHPWNAISWNERG